MIERLVVSPPNPELIIASTKWCVLVVGEADTGDIAIGRRFFDDLRLALLYVWRAHQPYEIRNRSNEMVDFGDELDIATAKSWIAKEAQLLKERDPDFDPKMYPHRVASGGDWHANDECRLITMSEMRELPTIEECDSKLWPCKSCIPAKKETDDVSEDA